MPNIKGIDLSDGITIIDAASIPHQFSASQIEAYLATHDIAQTEAQVAAWLNANVFDKTNDQCAVKILSTSPLQVTCIVAIKNYSVKEGDTWVTKQYQIPDDWWQ